MIDLQAIPETLVLGVGNVLFGDEGLGVHLASLLQQNYHFTIDDQTEHNATVSDHRAPHLAAIRPAHVLMHASPPRSPQPAAPCDRLPFRPRDHLHATLDIVDGGTLGPHLIPLLADYRRVLLLDTITASGAAPGEVFCFDYQQVPAPVTGRGSAHEVEMHQTLAMMRMAGDLPQITVLAVVPTIISETTFKLSPPIENAAVLMEEKALEILAGWGFRGTQVASTPVAEIARLCCREGCRAT